VNSSKRNTWIAGSMLVSALWMLNSCNETSSTAQAGGNATEKYSTPVTSSSVLSGTRIDVSLGSNVSSETASVGDSWHGTVTENVSTQNGTIPAGSDVDGVVTSAVAAKRGSRAMLELGVRSIRVNGHKESISASAEPVIAGSTRARNLGAIAGGAAAGALIGKVVGDGKNAAVGGLIGGAAATGVVASSKGYQVVLSDGTVMSFTVSQTVAMR
jgi:hypothetical protein